MNVTIDTEIRFNSFWLMQL